MTITECQRVFIKPEFQDAGDSNYAWFAVDNAEKGRVTISPADTGLAIAPRYVVTLDMLANA